MSDISSLRAEIISRGDWLRYYTDAVKEDITPDGDGWSQKLLCQFHDDTKPSMNVNIRTSGFKCFACDKAGSVFDFHMLKKGKDPRSDKRAFMQAFVELATYAGVDIGNFANGEYEQGTLSSDISNRPIKEEIPKVSKADKADSTNSPIAMSVAQDYHKALVADHYEYLAGKRGFTKETIEKRLLGWDERAFYRTSEDKPGRGRFTIPVLGRDGLLRNVRKYSQYAASEQKMINTKGYGAPPRLYPLHELIAKDWKKVVICEGEFDCILLNQKFQEAGLDSVWGAVTGTHGCTTFLAEWMDFLYGREVYFCFDADEAGRVAARDVCTKNFLAPIKEGLVPVVKIVELPLEGSKEDKDITDFFVKNGFEVDYLINVFNSTPPLEPGGVNNDEATIKPTDVDDFTSAIFNRRYIDKRIRVPLTISGQTSNIYHATREYQVVHCPAKDNCCSKELGPRTIPYGHDLFIQACMSSKAGIQKALSCVACISNQKCVVSPTKKVVMQEFFAHQVVHRWRAEENDQGKMENVQELTVAPIYILQPENGVSIEPKNYMAIGWVRSHPRTQQATLFVETLEPLEDEWQKFTVDSVNRAHLEKIRELGVGEILDQLTKNVTRIYESDEILMTVLLTYLSPIRFRFDGELIRGWINTCIIGDSGTGKSATYSRLADWLELGDLFSVLTGTRTGLLYAVKQKGTEWYVHVGRYVTASGTIIAIDEAQEAPAEEIKKMALAMDKGELEVAQVAQAYYRTETRTIFLMNPKGDKKISDYPFGCMSLIDCFHPMFIRRIDLAVFATAKEDHSFYNTKANEDEEVKLTPSTLKALIHWAWTRKASNVVFSSESVTHCLDRTKELSEKYGHPDDVPLVDPQGYRKELARLSVAFAILSGSFSEDLESVIVLPEHIDTMSEFVDTIYSSSSCNLLQHARSKRKKNTLPLDDFEKIKYNFETLIKNAANSNNAEYAQSNFFCQLLLLLQQQQEGVRIRDLKDQLGNVSFRWLQRHVTVLKAYNLIEIVKSAYKTTRKFNKFMLQWQSSPEIEKMLEEVYSKIGQSALLQDSSNEFYGRVGDQPPPGDDPF